MTTTQTTTTGSGTVAAAPTTPTTVAVKGGDPYWTDLLHRCGLFVVDADRTTDAPITFVPPESTASADWLRARHGAGAALVGDARVHAALLGASGGVSGGASSGASSGAGGASGGVPRRAARGTRRITGLRGTGPLFQGCESFRMPAIVRTCGPSLVHVATGSHAPVIALPLPTAAEALGARPTLHAFPAPGGTAVHEIVSGCDHRALRRMVQNAVRLACHELAVPLALAGTTPHRHSGVLAIRIDADDFDATATATVLDALHRADLRATWFIDVERHARKNGAEAVREIAARGHEVQSHFFHHYTYRSATRNARNLRRSHAVLRRWGIETTGAAAPFGSYHRGVRDALRAERIDWSSEFSAMHDELPSYCFDPAQVPVHPVCPILLLDAGLQPPAVHEYYTDRLRRNLATGESTVFYGHPIRDLAAVPDLFVALRGVTSEHEARTGRPVWMPTLGEFKAFHDRRRQMLRDRAAAGDAPAPVVEAPPNPPMPDARPDDCEPWEPSNAGARRRRQAVIRFRRWLREVRRRS